jgi:hypothetical protein
MVQIKAKFAFELPFAIKMQGDYGGRPYCIQSNPEEIVVYAPAPRAYPWADKPFWSPSPENIVGRIGNEPVWEAKYIIMDIKKDFLTVPITSEDQEILVAKAREVLYKILTLYRWRERQVHVSVKNIERMNYHLHYFDAADNPIIASPQGTQKIGALHMLVTLVSPQADKWSEICQHLISGAMPQLYESLLLDAYSVVSEEPRRAILDATTACEVFIDSFCESASKNNPEIDPIVYSALTRHGGFLYYFHEVLKYLFKKSLMEDRKDLYDEIDRLIRTNNSVKHEGKCQYKDDNGKVIAVDSAGARKFIKAVEAVIQYTKTLLC